MTLAGPFVDLLRRAPGFRLLFLATFGSGVGTMLAVIVLSVDVYERTGSGAWVSALLIADFLPTIAVGLLLGPLVDRLPRRRLMIASDLLRLAVFAALPFAPSAAFVVAGALVVGFGNGFFRPAAYAGMPNLVDERELPRANSLFQATENLTWMLGPLIGGALLAVAGPELPYALNAATFLLSAGLLARIPAGLLASEQPLSRGHWRDLAEGFGFALRSRPIVTVLVVWSLGMLGNAGLNVAEVFLVRDAFGAGNFELGLMMATIGLGLVVGSLLAGPLLDRLPIATVYAGGIVLMGVTVAATASVPTVWVALPLVLLAGLGNGAATVCNPLLVQWGAPDRVRGRAFTIVMSVNWLALGVGMAVAGPLTDAAGPRSVWMAAGGVLVLAAALAAVLARPIRAPAEPEPPIAVVPPAAPHPGEAAEPF